MLKLNKNKAFGNLLNKLNNCSLETSLSNKNVLTPANCFIPTSKSNSGRMSCLVIIPPEILVLSLIVFPKAGGYDKNIVMYGNDAFKYIFEELKTQILAATTTSLNQTLLGHIQFSLKFWVLYEGLEIFTFKFMNKSVMKKDSENSKPIDLKEMDRLKDKFRNTAEWYSQRITKYLDQNQSSFPLWQNPGSDIDTIHPNRNKNI